MGDIVLTDERGQIVTPVKSVRSQQAQLGQKIYFWHNPKTDHIFQGAPPQFDAFRPPGYVTIECTSAHMAEQWSRRLADQDRRMAEMNDYEREMIEGPMRANLRRDAVELLRKTNNPLAARMLKYSIEQLDKQEEKGKTIRESYLHVEAFEHGK